MSEECKTARNAVLIPLIVLIALVMFCSSCSSTYTTCPAYASVEVKYYETEAIHENLTEEELEELVKL